MFYDMFYRWLSNQGRACGLYVCPRVKLLLFVWGNFFEIKFTFLAKSSNLYFTIINLSLRFYLDPRTKIKYVQSICPQYPF